MAKIHIKNNFQTFLPFFLTKGLDIQYKQFLASDLGHIYKAIPWPKIIRCLGFREYKKGQQPIFSPQGKIALMILKSYTNLSDKRLIEQLNGNLHYQFFCGVRLNLGQQITNHKIVSAIRCELAQSLKIKNQEVQKALAQHWNPFIKKKHRVLMDATVYEVSLRYPTDTKLLLESVYYSYKTMKKLCRKMGIKLPRTKYRKWEKKASMYQRKRRKSWKETRKINKGLLRLLDKLLSILECIEEIIVKPHEAQIRGRKIDLKNTTNYITDNQKLTPSQNKLLTTILPPKYYTLKETIKNIYLQQNELATQGTYPKNRILSIRQPHLRPIKRGKETKNIEIGAKVNKIQIGGINYIDYISFSSFNEANRLSSSVELAQNLTETTITEVGADAIYATNKNRKWLTQRKIKNGFIPKGPEPKGYEERKKLKRGINKERSTRLEGSFGTEKEHYGLKRIKARTPETQMLCIFFGIHTKNALEIGRRMSIPP